MAKWNKLELAKYANNDSFLSISLHPEAELYPETKLYPETQS